MHYRRLPIEIEAPEQMGYERIRFNLTESSVRDARLGDLDLNLNDLVLAYGDHLGHKPLRDGLARDYGVEADDILVTVGAAAALFIVASTLLQKGDRLLVVRPNYATNLETPRSLGAQIDFYDLKFENGYRIDVREFIARITPETRLVSITTPHNPTGMVMTEAEIRQISEACARSGARLLVDETYRDMNFDRPHPLAATFGPHVISVASLSKSYGLPGIRMGWLVNRDPKLKESFLAAKEQIFITGSLVDEVIATQYLARKESYFPQIRDMICTHRKIVETWLAEEKRIECVKPEGGVVCFPRIREDAGIDVEAFHRVLNDEFGTFVGPGHWFEQSRASMRIGYAWTSAEELREGLRNISRALDATQKQ